MNTRNPSYPYASDQSEDERSASPSSGQSSGSSSRASPATMPPAYPMTPISASSSPAPQTGAFLQASPQQSGAPLGDVARINTGVPPTPPQYLVSGNTTLLPNQSTPSISSSTNESEVYRLLPDNKIIMDKQVRQFYAADGASFIEHVPGHCLVFIPNTTNIGYVARELRRIRPQRPRPKPRGSGSSKPTNAFIKYRNHKINELKEMYPDISQTEISRMAGRCWETEDESVKIEFRKQYLEDKRIYDMNKAKRQCLEGGIGFDSDGMLGSTSSTSNRGMLGSTPSTSGGDRNSPGKMPDLGFGSDGRPAGFNTGRRRSHTLPSGGFSHYSPKRRISQELRKHLANKNNTYYTAIAASTGVDSSFVPSNGYVSSESSTSNSSMAVSSGANFLFGVPQQQLQQPRYDFTFAAPPADIAVASSSAQPPSSSSSSTIGMDLSSPYMGYDSSTMAMPLNPSFPIAEFSDAHGRVVSQNAQGYSLGQAAFPAVSQDALAPFMQSTDSIAKSLADSAIATSLPMINTNIMSFSNDRMAIDGFSAGYISADTPSLDATPYRLPEPNAYSSVPSDHSQRQ